MKRVFTLLLFCLVITKLSAQTASNESYDLTFVDGGFTIKSKKECSAEVRINYQRGGLVKDTTLVVPAMQTVFVGIFATEIKIKSDAPCSSSGWLRVAANINILPIREPVTYQPPVAEKNNIISIYNASWQRIRTLREKDLSYSLSIMEPGVYYVRGSKTITQICNKCLR